MKNTTLCYIERGGQYLMLYRNKKRQDENAGKWLGVGGKLEAGESPEECVAREVREETGLTLTEYRLRGLVTFVSGDWCEYMFLFTAAGFEGALNSACDEGELAWVDQSAVPALPLWEGDRIFLRLLKTEERFFSLKLEYGEGEKLQKAMLNGKPLPL